MSGGVCRGAFAAAKTNREGLLGLGEEARGAVCDGGGGGVRIDTGAEGCTHGGIQHGAGESEGGQDHHVEWVGEIGLGKGCQRRVRRV